MRVEKYEFFREQFSRHYEFASQVQRENFPENYTKMQLSNTLHVTLDFNKKGNGNFFKVFPYFSEVGDFLGK